MSCDSAELLPKRSPSLMNPAETALLVVDLQERLCPSINGIDGILPRASVLVDAAKLLGVRTLATEQYPKGLGPTVPELAAKLDKPFEKMTFSAGIDPAVRRQLDEWKTRKLLVVGIEAHVCVQQTVLDLIAGGFQVYVAVDAVGSRRTRDAETALHRMTEAGAVLTTTEAALFEWTVVAGTDPFKQISRMVKSLSVDN